MFVNEIPENPSAIFLSHGGGPRPLLGDPQHTEMITHLEAIAATIEKPSAIIVVSAHWEEPVATITAHPRPPMIYDYHGFPAESYQLQYPAPGDPDLAHDVHEILARNRIEARLDRERGFDHGLFVPLLLMYPDADIPCIQLSLVGSLDPAEHIRLGEALSALAGDNVLVLGSGFSFHNFRARLTGAARDSDPDNKAFEEWLIATCTSQSLAEDERVNRLIGWDSAPGARYCHPREEHLMPLHVCYGVGKRAASAHAELRIMQQRSSMYFWSP